MKKLKAGVICLLSVSLLSGCSSSSGEMIKSYSNTALNTKSLIINTDMDDNFDFFAENLAVFPKRNTVISEEKEKAEETEDESQTETEKSGKVKDEKAKNKTDDEMETDVEDAEEDETSQNETGIDAYSGLLAGTDNLKNVYGKDIYERVYPASLTKVMTALITLEKANFNDKVIFTEDMVENEYAAKLCGYQVGDELTVEQLFNTLLIYSGNDSANALAIHISGSIDAFTELMNKEAKRLGCVDTHFVNAGGLHDNNHYTSAYDMYLIFNECLKYETFSETIRQSVYKTSYKDAAGETVYATYSTTNQYFLDTYDYPENMRVLGGKTGTTDEAGSCLILYDMDEANNGYISVILGAQTSEQLYSEMNILLNKIPK